jgi:hypothetical protein
VQRWLPRDVMDRARVWAGAQTLTVTDVMVAALEAYLAQCAWGEVLGGVVRPAVTDQLSESPES